MKPYADSNFLVRLYVESDWLEPALRLLELVGREGVSLPVNWLHRTEVRNAFQLLVFTSACGTGDRFSVEAAAAAQARFRDDVRDSGSPLRPTAISVDDWERQAEELILRHSFKCGFRTYDVLHVAAALCLGADVFWSFDKKCNTLAQLEGLEIAT
jgi:predicted nucleic acid-binding protein